MAHDRDQPLALGLLAGGGAEEVDQRDRAVVRGRDLAEAVDHLTEQGGDDVGALGEVPVDAGPPDSRGTGDLGMGRLLV